MAKETTLLLFGLLALCWRTVNSQWDFAITTDSKIMFYDEHWNEITSAAHQFDHLSAIAFDETEEIVYFSDEFHSNASIFSLKIPHSPDDPHFIDKAVQRMQNETIRSIAYDPLKRNIYWTDIRNKRIYMTSVDAPETTLPTVFVDFTQESTLPDGLAIDFCRRTLYWTNSNIANATIERINLDGSNRKVIVHKDLYLPHGIVVDQLTDRIYWVVDQQAKDFWVESADLDGGDRQVIVKGLNNDPYRLAVTKDGIFWTDLIHRAVWGHEKVYDKEEPVAPNKILTFNDRPLGIVTRTRFLTNLQNDEHCAVTVKNITARLLRPKPTRSPTDIRIELLQREYCLNGGEYSEHSTRCICKIGFKGARCEVNECHNYCVHGTCIMSPLGFPACSCQKGFYGSRCQSSKCVGYCYNEGVCRIESNNDPTCECKNHFGGERCEQNSTEICALFCRILKHEPETDVPFGCLDICEELAAENGADVYAIPKYKHLEQVCKHGETWTSTVIIVLVCSVVACLCLVLLIVHALRRFYKPARPRIKKTFVVRKQAAASSDTPLTNRPIATEQCEITIENCCNMNICDTPCFDPKLVQQTLSRSSNTKEDKKMLIHSMEDELY